MVSTTVAQEPVIGQAARPRDGDGEEACCRIGCRQAKQEAACRLQALAHRLQAQRPATWCTKGWRERTLVPRFGEVRGRRRRYRDEPGAYPCLWDDHRGWEKAQVVPPPG